MPFTPRVYKDKPDRSTPVTSEDAAHWQSQYAQAMADAAALYRGAPIAKHGQDYRMVGCTVRNTGAGWALLEDAGHEPIGVSGVSVSGGFIRIALDFTATTVGGVVAGVDETFLLSDMRVAPSVALDTISLAVGKSGGCYDYVAWNGTAWTFSTGFVTGVAINGTTGVITFTHEEVTEALGGVVEMRTDGTNRVAAGGRTATTMQATVFPYNSATSLKTPTTDMRFFITRPGLRKLDPTTLVSASGNFWVVGVLEAG